MTSNTLSVKESLLFGWRTFKTRPWFFVGTFLLYAVVQIILSSIQSAMQHPAPYGEAPDLPSFLLSLIVSTLLYTGLITIYLKAHDNPASPTYADYWRPQPFLRYLGASLLLGVIIIIGCFLLIVPGVIAAVAFSFTGYLVIDRGLNPIAALKESARITKGNRWKLFLLGLAILGLSILAVIPFLLGLLVMGPVSMLAGVHAYRTLEHAAHAG